MKIRHISRPCLLLLLVWLPSCLTIEQDIALKLDGSARVRMSYQVPAVFAMNSQVLNEMRKRIGFAFPLTENEMREYYRGIPDVSVDMFTSTTVKGVYQVEAVLSCTRIEGLSHSPVIYTLRDLGGVKVFSISVGTIGLPPPPRPPKKPGTPSTGALLENVIAASQRGLMLKFTATFPTRVLSSNGKISGRRVTWFTPYVLGGSSANTFEARYRAAPSLWDKIRDILGFTQ